MGMGHWKKSSYDVGDLRGAIRAQRNRNPAWPMLLRVTFGNGARHWVVCDRNVEAPDVKGTGNVTWAMISDPWDGDVWPIVLKKGECPDYCPGPSGTTWTQGKHYLYGAKSVGWLDGMMVRRGD